MQTRLHAASPSLLALCQFDVSASLFTLHKVLCLLLMVLMCPQARLSMELQRDSHIKQQRLIQERWKREARREAIKTRPGPVQPSSSPALLPEAQSTGHFQPHGSTGVSAAECGGIREREYDTLLYQLQTRQTGGGQPLTPPCPGSKTTKDDKNPS